MRRLLVIGLNHNTAPLDVRERLAFAPQQSLFALGELQKRLPGSEAVLLSTCNRVEIYVAAPEQIETSAIQQFLSDFHELPRDKFTSHLYELRGNDVVKHLFTVSSSLDSMVVGETQILGQVRNAYETARSAGAAGPTLHPLFQRAVAVGKEVLSATSIAEGRVSVGSVAVDYARRIFNSFSDKTMLCVGTGKMAHTVLNAFKELRPGKLLICSRDQTRADAIAKQFNGAGVTSEALDKHLIEADIVITSTGHPHLITRQRFEPLMKARRYRPIFLIDIAVPRDIDSAVGEIDRVYLYNLDDLQEVIRQTVGLRSASLEPAREIVNKHVTQYMEWHRQREIGPTIDALYKRYNAVAQAELQRTLLRMDVSDEQKQQMQEMVHRMVQKLLHDPVSRLRESPDPHMSAQIYLHAIEKIFKLENDE